ncbi:hypothetical protein HGP14_29750 [Rhizobium sp. P32RR-XVIII]|uniref:hypothetical protein n=1 Tax=Rhizobium sp. P32RR-XVIII TaxID=2726738 RepID=UPI001456C9D7|nr:hypothetical protein [Rhizobium sp. P32RR-XVIII]NLS07462.1 hypothetical protein [Rhizobium sp. P32RR-XVIII]
MSDLKTDKPVRQAFYEWNFMKSQQRRFVVEIKSKGRRSAVRQGSIWGTTDLKAVTRQAASVAPQLFDDARATVDIATDEPTLVVAPVPAAPAPVDVDNEGSAPVELKAVVPTVAAPALIVETPPSTGGNTAAKVRPPRVAVAGVKRRSRTVQKRIRAAARNLIVTDEPLTHDLAVLELENRRLKLLLAEQLRQQNRELRAMLERFDGIH